VNPPAVAPSPRERLILDHLPLVDAIARRYAGRGEPYDDLVQAGAIGLVKSADRFDPDRGVAFASYAAPTIRGEIRRHFRDRGWAVHVPRRLKDLALRVGKQADALTTRLGRVPTIEEIARAEGISIDVAAEALGASHAYAARSLLEPRDEHDTAPSWLESLGHEDPGFGARDLRWEIEPALEALDARERQIVVMRFWGEMVQSQIARHMGISQMHVSRLIRRSLLKMRDAIETVDETPRRDSGDPQPPPRELRPSGSLPPAA
jgi:RNA polymerase sigma-B factor